MPRVNVPGERQVEATCDYCKWHCDKKNAQGLAAQHADNHPGHEVRVTVLQHYRVYNDGR